MPPRHRTTAALRAVLSALLDAPDAHHYGYDLSRASGVRSGAMYPILARLLERGWLSDGWEEVEKARRMSRPPRRYYRLTGEGRRAALTTLERIES